MKGVDTSKIKDERLGVENDTYKWERFILAGWEAKLRYITTIVLGTVDTRYPTKERLNFVERARIVNEFFGVPVIDGTQAKMIIM